MTTKADFTPEEWELVREGPPTAGMVALTAESGGTFRESWALAKAYTEARKEHGESELLDALVAEKPDLKRYKTTEELEDQGLRRLTEAVALLEQKATAGEVVAYKKFALGVAERVAEAHKEGDRPVSAGERTAIEKLEASLYPSGST
jgi:phage-related baseplate assembly protein